MASPLANAIQFLVDFGFFDVVLPFILVFTITFAVLEKTRIFGKEDDLTKKNINSMIAFVIALFVVATPKIVTAIQVSLPQIALILIVLISFMLLMGTMFTGDKEFSLKGGWSQFLSFILFFGVLGIFLNAFNWLTPLFSYVADKWTDTLIVSLIFLGIVVGIIFYVVGNKPNGGSK